MKVKAGIVIDLGNSETRLILLTNQQAIQKEFSNRFANHKGNTIPKEYVNDKSTIFVADGMYYANGLIVEREYKGKELRPTALKKKIDQLTTDLSLNLICSRALLTLSEMYTVPVKDLDVTFNITLAVPPLEHEQREQDLIAKVKAFNNVNIVLPKQIKSDFVVDNVTILPEGFLAYMGAMFKEEKNELVSVEDNSKFDEGYVIVLDIGAGTTDVVLIKDSELIRDSKDTFDLGGNTVESMLKRSIKKDYNYVPVDVSDAIATGMLTEGVTQYSVESQLNEAKDSFSKALTEELITYVEGMALQLKNIKGILVAGGGALPAIRDGKVVSPAMGSTVAKYLKELAPNMEEVSTNGKNPRYLNIEGAMYYHKYMLDAD